MKAGEKEKKKQLFFPFFFGICFSVDRRFLSDF